MQPEQVTRPAPVYVGPRPFETGEKLYGRDRETAELTNLLLAERIVLMYAPSGAGKSSLLNAALIPAMGKGGEGFEVAPVVRLNYLPPGGLPRGANRYRLSTLRALEEGRPAGERRTDAELAGLGLAAYLHERFDAAPRTAPLLLLFDQFEELLRVDPTDENEKRAFVRELAEALRDRGRWALFVMREDFLAAMDPYRPEFPTRLGATYRLDLLRREAALEAIRKPAQAAGAAFADGVAESLVDDLRQVRVQKADGTFEPKAGPHVEPVHLQVVCQELWRVPRQDPARITAKELEGLEAEGIHGVDAALAAYYAGTVHRAAEASGVGERLVRDWFGKRLITAQGVRRPVLRGEEANFGLTAECLRVLDRAYLVRADDRAGTVWYELAHDRLVDPVVRDNSRWRKAHLIPLQLQAELWYEGGRPDRLLARGHLLAEGERWAAALPPGAMTEAEKEYLAASREVGRAERRNRLYKVVVGVLAALLVLLAAGFYVYSRYRDFVQERDRTISDVKKAIMDAEERERIQRRELDRQQKEAEFLRTVLRISATAPADGRSAVRSAIDLLKSVPPGVESPEAEELLRNALGNYVWQSLSGLESPVGSSAFSPRGNWLAAGSFDGRLTLWRYGKTGFTTDNSLKGQPGRTQITALAFSPDQTILVTGRADGTLATAEVTDHSFLAKQGNLPFRHLSSVKTILFSSDGNWVVSTAANGSGCLWDRRRGDWKPTPLVQYESSAITTVAFTPIPKKLYVGTADGKLESWDLQHQSPERKSLRLYTGASITSLAINPSATNLAVGAYDKSSFLLSVWEMRPDGKEVTGKLIDKMTLTSPTATLAFSPDGKWLVAVFQDRTLKLWGLVKDRWVEQSLLNASHTLLTTVTFGTSSETESKHWLLAGGSNGTALLWSLDKPDLAPWGLRGHAAAISTTAFSADGKWILTASLDGVTRLWEVKRLTDDQNAEPRVLRGQDGPVSSGAFAPVSGQVATASYHGDVSLWDRETAAQVGRFPYPPPADERLLKTAIAFGPGDHLVTALTGRPVLRQCDLTDGQKSMSLAAFDDVYPAPTAPPDREYLRPSLSKDGRMAAVNSKSRGCVVGRVTEGTAVRTEVRFSTFAKHGGNVAWGSGDNRLLHLSNDTLEVWEVRWEEGESQLVKELKTSSRGLTVAAESEDGAWLAAGDTAGDVWLWRQTPPDKAMDKPMRLHGHRRSVSSLAFGDLGGRPVLASGSYDATARVWSLGAKEDAISSSRFVGHDSTIWSVGFSRDGKLLLTTSDDGTARMWALSTEELVKRARQLLGENQ
jgi:WD40 repeat protein